MSKILCSVPVSLEKGGIGTGAGFKNTFPSRVRRSHRDRLLIQPSFGLIGFSLTFAAKHNLGKAALLLFREARV
jgi:hypothetical protein